MSEFRINIVGEDKTDFMSAFEMIFRHVPGGKAVGYKIVEKELPGEEAKCKKLVFCWGQESTSVVPFPCHIGLELAASEAWSWLQSVEYGEQPDVHDIDCEKGWILYNGD